MLFLEVAGRLKISASDFFQIFSPPYCTLSEIMVLYVSMKPRKRFFEAFNEEARVHTPWGFRAFSGITSKEEKGRCAMKKLLCAIAVGGLCSAVSAVESSNVVGYMTPENDVAGGNKMMGAMFADVGTQTAGSGTYSVQNIVPTGASVPNGETLSTSTCIYLQKLTPAGGTDGDILYWRDGSFKQGKKTVDFHGWYADGATTPATTTLTTGQAVWLYVPAGAIVAFTMSGEVPSGDVYMALNQNNTAVCNPQPATISLQSVVPAAASGYEVPNGSAISTATCLYLQKLTSAGGTAGDILYWRNGTFKQGKKTVDFCGWYADGATTTAEVSLNPGEGLWVFSPSAGLSLSFPTVLSE